MHPNVFLRSFWRLELHPRVFVAMSFASEYSSRFTEVYAPAIQSIPVGGHRHLEPHRVDLTMSGDSILTEIMDGVAHDHLVVADVSIVGRDSKSGKAYRNSNVMYEVGLALACRQPNEVLLVRDDHDPFLFDVTTIPHLTIDFTDVEEARRILAREITGRLQQQTFVEDVRVQIAASSLSPADLATLRAMLPEGVSTALGLEKETLLNSRIHQVLERLLDKGLVRATCRLPDGDLAYNVTPLGHAVCRRIDELFPVLKGNKTPLASRESSSGGTQNVEGSEY